MGNDVKKLAVRNLRLCTKDCLCLFVCPTGATDTENSIIDTSKCIGCGACAEACPSGAISLVPCEYPAPQRKKNSVIAALGTLSESKCYQEKLMTQIAAETDKDGLRRLLTAMAKSERLLASDLTRESGYMLPQSDSVRTLLQGWAYAPPVKDFPADAVLKLLEKL